jgi:hypothetical protein
MRILMVLSLFIWTPAWAGHALDPVVDTWSAIPTPQGGTVYSNGLDQVETYRSGPSSSTYYGWDRDGRQTMGTVYQTVPRAQPSESLSEWAQRTLPSSRSTSERRR